MSDLPLVSVAVVTYGRAPLLPLLLEQFDAQTWPARQLVVLDDSPAPCSWLAELRRPDVVYRHLTERLTVGAKRNRILELLAGSLVCQWDDDDHYAPGYLQFAAEQLRDADFVKLDRWFVHSPADGSLSLWDTRLPPAGGVVPASGSAEDAWVERNRLGYGFSFSYRREVLEAVKSPDTSIGDDYTFARSVVDHGLRVRLLADPGGLVLHLVHGGNLSCCFPARRLPASFVRSLFPAFDPDRYLEAIARCAVARPLPG